MAFNFIKSQTASDLEKNTTKLNLKLTDFKKQNAIPVGTVVAAIDRLPAFHLEQLKEITYDKKRSILKDLANSDRDVPASAKGMYIQNHRTVAIFDVNNKDVFLHTLFHEIGHHVYFCVIGQQLKKAWVTEVCRKDAFITNYAALNAAEDFAESYVSYLLYPEEMESIPLKYNFMKNFVFEGREPKPPPEKLNLLF